MTAEPCRDRDPHFSIHRVGRRYEMRLARYPRNDAHLHVQTFAIARAL